MAKVNFVTIGTNKYFNMAIECMNSVQKYVKSYNDHMIFTCIYSDMWDTVKEKDELGHFGIYARHLPWPLVTLLRYHTFLSDPLCLVECDYTIFLNADMRFVKDVYVEDMLGDIIAVQHPGYYNSPPMYLPFEQNQHSTACVQNSGINKYYQASLMGGKTDIFLEICGVLRDNINSDLRNNIIALWHDESHWNHYLNLVKEPDKVLDPSWDCPEGWDHISQQFGSPKIIKLNKNHNEIRS